MACCAHTWVTESSKGEKTVLLQVFYLADYSLLIFVQVLGTLLSVYGQTLGRVSRSVKRTSDWIAFKVSLYLMPSERLVKFA